MKKCAALAALLCSAACGDEGGEILEGSFTLKQSPPVAYTGQAYSAQLELVGGTEPYRFSRRTSQSIAPGLKLDAQGAITGTPTIVGRYTFDVVVVDATNAVSNIVVYLQVQDGRFIEASCEDPVHLDVSNGIVQLSGRFPREARPTRAECGGSNEAHVYLRIAVAGRAELIVVSTEGAAVSLLHNQCPGLLIAGCEPLIQTEVEAGIYLIEVTGPAEAGFTVTISATLPFGPAAPTCDAPQQIDLSQGTITLSGETGGSPNQHQGSCGDDEDREAVFTFTLDGPAYVRFDSENTFYLRSSDCGSGAEVICDWREDLTMWLPAGRYFLFVEGEESSEWHYQIIVEHITPPDVVNDSCTSATPLSFDSNGVAEVTATLLGAERDASPGCRGEYALYFTFTLSEQSFLWFDNHSGVDFELRETCDGLPLFCEGNDVCNTLPAGSYVLRVSEDDDRSVRFTATRSVLPTPTNDTCDTAEPITSSSFRHLAGLRQATSSGVVACGGDAAEVDLFYTINLQERSDLQIDAPHYVDHIAVFQGSCGQLELFSCGEDAFGLPPGPTFIRISEPPPDPYSCGIDPAELNLTITPSPTQPANDTCANATVVPVALNSVVELQGTTRGASNSWSEVTCNSGGWRGADAFYRIDVPAPARLAVLPNPISSSFRHELSLHLTCTTTAAIACGDRNGVIETPAGLAPAQYYLRVDQESGDTPEDFSLTIQLLDL